MCGIIGYIGQNDVAKKILHNLKKLEYRGYDSSGICLKKNNTLFVKKSVGEISNLQSKININFNSHVGIAHTRWATHGKVNVTNTHPHISQDKMWAVVHNGIIENYLEITKQLKEKGIHLYSETDSEVIANLMAISQKQNNALKLHEVTTLLHGSYALCLINAKEETLYIARRHSPLYVAHKDDACMVSSDPACFSEDFHDYYVLPDECIATVNSDGVTFYDQNMKILHLTPCEIGTFEKSSELGKYSYYAEKEISEIPHVLNDIILNYQTVDHFKHINKSFLKHIKSIKLIGCGTAYHACMIGAKYLEKFTKIEANAYIASEFRYQNPMVDKNTLCIFLSQSGETADTLLSLELAKSKGAKTLAIVNVPYSSIARNADIVLPLCAGIEIAVMSTKAYNAMLMVLYLLSVHIANINNDFSLTFPSEVKYINFFKNIEKIDEISDLVLKSDKTFFIGRGEDYVTALEAGLKLKEITYINCVSLPSGELKHGTISLIDKKSLVFVISTDEKLLSKNLTSASEIKARGGKIVLVTNLDVQDNKDVDYIYKIDRPKEEISSILSVIPFQVLAYKTCLKKGYSPDKPRNLAKSVTVE